MASEFSNGLLTGFQFVEGIADRRERRRQADEEIGLRRAANSRAEEAFKTQQGIISDTQLRQRQTDSSNVMLARAQERGIENLEPYEIQQLEEAAAYNPNISAAIADMRLGKRDTEAIQSIAGLANRPRSLSDVATARPAPQPQAAPSDGSLSPMDVVTQREQLPPSAVAPGTTPVSGAAMTAADQGEKSVSVGEFGRMYPGVDVTSLGDAYRPSGPLVPHGMGGVRLPQEFKTEDELAGLPLVDRQGIVDKQRAMLGDGNFSTLQAASRQRVAHARDTVASYRGFVDPKDEAGADLRRLAAEDPLAASLEFAGDFNTLKTMDPNTLAIVQREMGPVVNRATAQASQKMRALPVGPNGRIANSADTRSTMKSFNTLLTLQQNMSDGFKADLAAQIRRGSMPVGNAELASDVAQTVANTPRPAQPATADELRTNFTVAKRAVANVASGTRNLSTKQVESLAWLAKRGYISPDGFEQFLSTGTFQKPSDAKFIDHDPSHLLFAADGTLLYMPPKPSPKPEDVSAWAPNQQEWIHDQFAPPPGATPEQIEQAKRMESSFYITANQNAPQLWGSDINANDYRTMSQSDLALLTARFKALQDTRSAFDDHWFYGNGLVQLFNGGAEDQGLTITNFDEMARRFGTVSKDQQLPLPVPKPQVDAARMALAASDDETDRIMARISTDAELGQAITEAKGNQNPPPPMVTSKK